MRNSRFHIHLSTYISNVVSSRICIALHEMTRSENQLMCVVFGEYKPRQFEWSGIHTQLEGIVHTSTF